MECPRCGDGALALTHSHGIEVDRCPKCEGQWLDYPELDQLEDIVFDDDRLKGTMMYAQRSSDISCPKCQGPMTIFNYRAYNLPIDFCDAGHGFWLDRGEEKRVLDLMEQRGLDLKRSGSAEAEWTNFLQRIKSPSFLNKIKGRFRR